MGIVPFADKKGQRIANLYIDDRSEIFYLVISVKGKTRFKSLRTKSLTVAKSKMAAATVQVTTAGPKDKSEATPHLQKIIKDHWADFVDLREAEGVKPTTLIKMNEVWTHSIEPYWGRKAASDCTQATVNEYVKWFRVERAGVRFFDTAKYLNAIFGYLLEHELIPLKGFPRLEIPLDEKKKMMKSIGRVPTEEEIELCLAACDEETQLKILLGYERGMRKMEIGSLHIRQIHKEGSTTVIHVEESKTGKERDIPVSHRAAALLEKQIEKAVNAHIQKGLEKTAGYLFPRLQKPWMSEKKKQKIEFAKANGKRVFLRPTVWHIPPQTIDRAWARAKSKAKIKGRLRFHDLRHGAVHKFKRMGLDSLVACDLLGMSIRQYEKVYGKLTTRDKIEALDRFGGNL